MPGQPLRPASILAVLFAVAIPTEAQTTLSLPVPRAPELPPPSCFPPGRSVDPVRGRILAALASRSDEARRDLVALVDSLGPVVEADPDDLEPRFLLAAAWGARAELEGARTRIRAAGNAFEHARQVLEAEPSHPGGHFLLGRLHAAVMRMDGVTRFVATRLLGGDRLAGASWTQARTHLEAAVQGDPCTAAHHFELARLYAEMDEPDRALRQVARLMALSDSTTADRALRSKGRDLVAALALRHPPRP